MRPPLNTMSRAIAALPGGCQIQRRAPATMTTQRTRLGAWAIVMSPVSRFRKNHCRNLDMIALASPIAKIIEYSGRRDSRCLRSRAASGLSRFREMTTTALDCSPSTGSLCVPTHCGCFGGAATSNKGAVAGALHRLPLNPGCDAARAVAAAARRPASG